MITDGLYKIEDSTIDFSNDKDLWYSKTKKYWEEAETSIDGVLNGNANLHFSDVKTNCELMEGLIINKQINTGTILDVGAGIGRIAENVLINYFDVVDMLEQDLKYSLYAKTVLGNNSRVRNFYNSSIQSFEFENSYDVIWIQWVLENLEDDDLQVFLSKCFKSLNKGGLLLIKENIVSKGCRYMTEDFSKVRSDITFKKLFDKCGLKIIKHFHQPNWPKDMLKVSIFLLSKKYED